jgi:outer membrane protein assembly factor BamB
LAMLAALFLGVSGCTGGAVRPMSWTGLVAVGERLYAADLEQVRALNAADGESLWAFPKDPKEDRLGAFSVTPAVGEGRVIVASEMPAAGFFSQPKHVVWALDRDTGKELWHFEGAGAQYVEGGVIGGDLFIIGNSDGNVYALDVDSGVLRWVFETGHRVWATPLIVSDTVYIGSMDHHLGFPRRRSLRQHAGVTGWHILHRRFRRPSLRHRRAYGNRALALRGRELVLGRSGSLH